jgi:hypothetical protein
MANAPETKPSIDFPNIELDNIELDNEFPILIDPASIHEYLDSGV